MSLIAAIALAGCSAGAKLQGPSWNLTGGKGATPIPERPLNPNPPVAARLPTPDRNVPVYSGGRDPVSGRAPAWGTPQGLSTPAQPAAQPPIQPVTSPVYTPPTTQPPLIAPQARLPARPGTIEVRPGQSLSSIAAEQRVSIAALMQVNNLRDPYVIPGQILVLPGR